MKALALAAVALALVAARDDPLKGYAVSGKPENCIQPFSNDGPQIVDAHTILYREGASRFWRTGPIGACPALRPFTTLIVERFGGQLCRNDRFRVLEPGVRIPSAYCRFDRFTPYTKPKR